MIENSENKKVKIIVRIRSAGVKSTEDKGSESDECIKRIDSNSTPKNLNSKNVTKSIQKSTFKITSNNKSKSKSPLKKEPKTTSSTVASLNCLNENIKYSIFTSIAPSNTVVITTIPITGKIINDTFRNNHDLYEYSYSILKSSSLLEFDKVYNETHKIDLIYNEQIKDCINNLFMGKSSCCLLFGPMDGGKSYTLRGDKESNIQGLLGNAVQDLFNLVELSKQTNVKPSSTKNKTSTYFGVKLSVYQVYLNQINDLLTSQYTRNLKIDKYYDNENKLKTQILDLTQKETRNKKDYDYLIMEAMHYRKSLSQYLRINEMKRKSNLVISITLEKREKTSEGFNKTLEKAIDRFAQIDFVELASSNYGLGDISIKKKEDPEFDEILYKNTSKNFNALCNNIVSSTMDPNTPSKLETKLTLALKSTLEEQVVFVSCVLPGQDSITNSLKCLKFTNWLRNQVCNIECNRNYKIKSDYEEDSSDENEEHSKNYYKKNIQYNINSDHSSKNYIEDEENNYRLKNCESSTLNNNNRKQELRELHSSSNEEDELRNMRRRIKNNKMYNESNTNINNNELNSQQLNTRNSQNLSNLDLDNFDNLPHPKDQKLIEVEKSLRDLEVKSLEMSRYIDNMKMERSRQQSQYINQEDSLYSNHKYSSFELENDRIKVELATMKSDNIIFREDINRLSEVNTRLEDDLVRQRNRNLELAGENERINQEKLILKNEIEKLSENYNKVKIQDQNMMEHFNQKFIYENKIRDLEIENRSLRDEKQKYEVDFKVLSERHFELKKNSEILESELNFVKVKQSQEVNHIEERFDKMLKEIDFLQKENSTLRINEERIRQELNNLEKQRDNYRDKYQDYKVKNNILNSKLTEIEDDFRKIVIEKQMENIEKRKEDDSKKTKIDSKHKILEDMQNRISNYKTELFRQRNKKQDC